MSTDTSSRRRPARAAICRAVESLEPRRLMARVAVDIPEYNGDRFEPGAAFPRPAVLLQTIEFSSLLRGQCLKSATLRGSFGNSTIPHTSGFQLYLDDVLVTESPYTSTSSPEEWTLPIRGAAFAAVSDGRAEVRVVQTTHYNVRLGAMQFEGEVGKAPRLRIRGVIASGPPLDCPTIEAINAAVPSIPAKWRSFVAYEDGVRVGGSLAWRNNNPGNLRSHATQIARANGFAVFATPAAGEAAQRELYLRKYGERTVRDAIKSLTPSKENNTEKYLSDLARLGVDLDATVRSQIDLLMPAVRRLEGTSVGTFVPRG